MGGVRSLPRREYLRGSAQEKGPPPPNPASSIISAWARPEGYRKAGPPDGDGGSIRHCRAGRLWISAGRLSRHRAAEGARDRPRRLARFDRCVPCRSECPMSRFNHRRRACLGGAIAITTATNRVLIVRARHLQRGSRPEAAFLDPVWRDGTKAQEAGDQHEDPPRRTCCAFGRD